MSTKPSADDNEAVDLLKENPSLASKIFINKERMTAEFALTRLACLPFAKLDSIKTVYDLSSVPNDALIGSFRNTEGGWMVEVVNSSP
jgi:hypothetical protein